MIRLSPCIRVLADLPIRECISRMNAAGVGSILVIGEAGPEKGRLAGIFTERDVLRNFELLRKGDLSEKPVRTLMTRKLATISIGELGSAGSLMLERGFRHLPVVSNKEGTGAQDLLGVISMRDVLRWHETMKAVEAAAGVSSRKNATLWLESEDAGFKSLLLRLVESFRKSGREVQVVSNRGGVAAEVDQVFLDLDAVPRNEWSGRILASLQLGPAVRVTAVFDPSGLPAEWMSLLRRMDEKSDRFAALSKPVDVFALLDRLEGSSR